MASLARGIRVTYNLGPISRGKSTAINIAAASSDQQGMEVMGDGPAAAFSLPATAVQPVFPIFESRPPDGGGGGGGGDGGGGGGMRSVFADYKPFAAPPAPAPRPAQGSPPRQAPPPTDAAAAPLECPLTHADLRTTNVAKLVKRLLATERRAAPAGAQRISSLRTPAKKLWKCLIV